MSSKNSCLETAENGLVKLEREGFITKVRKHVNSRRTATNCQNLRNKRRKIKSGLKLWNDCLRSLNLNSSVNLKEQQDTKSNLEIVYRTYAFCK